ncbi:MAG: hypothetical protein JXD22_08865 [Sedimentisphaerales bacterium]|nr:hypothetical protein [Sedimentisphaerales bacterium]
MRQSRCAAGCGNNGCGISRRSFLQGTAGGILGATFLGGCTALGMRGEIDGEKITQYGPASKCVPKVKATFVRRKEEYGMWWPGAVYDGEAARERYTKLLMERAGKLGVELDLRAKPIFSLAEAEAWVGQGRAEKVDGLMVMLLDRQQHAWPTAHKAAESEIPTIIFSPVGSSFTTNTATLAERGGCVIYSTDDFSQPAYGMKMLAAGAKLKQTRCVVIKGNNRSESKMADLGIQLQYIPAGDFVKEYEGMGEPEEIHAMAENYMRQARQRRGATQQDVVNGIKSYCVARNILKREQADAITMDCLGALADKQISLPCIAWSRMNDDGVPAACEADLGAVASHVIVQYLFYRPGFQQDPVADTATDSIIGAHCSCPTRLNGFDRPGEPFDLVHHHGNRDAVPRTHWKPGRRVSCVDVLLGDGNNKPTEFLISEGTVLDNVAVPPAGGCVVSVRVKFDGSQEVLTFPGFHQLFFYGEYGKQLRDFCKLYKLKAKIV